MSKTEILEELPNLTKMERQENRLRLPKLDSDHWLDSEDPLTVHEKALLEARLAAYANDPDAVAHGKKLIAESELALVNGRKDDLYLITQFVRLLMPLNNH
jgi:hypothetical protein